MYTYIILTEIPIWINSKNTCRFSSSRNGFKCDYFYLQSSKIKKGSKGDINMLQPTLMAAVPVSRKEQMLLLQGNLRVHKFEKKLIMEASANWLPYYGPSITTLDINKRKLFLQLDIDW